jgi:hypothetical protein
VAIVRDEVRRVGIRIHRRDPAQARGADGTESPRIGASGRSLSIDQKSRESRNGLIPPSFSCQDGCVIAGPELLIVLFIVSFPVVGYLIGRTKGRPVLGAVLGFFLNVVGWIIIAVVPPRSP